MRKRLWMRIGLGAVALVLILGIGWIYSLPPAPAAGAAPPPIAEAEYREMVAALRPPRARRPLVAIVGINDATETTDYVMPYGILRRADVADVVALATGPGPIRLFPALKVQPEATVADFDARHAEGADYVIVPAMSRDADPAVLQWIRRQKQKGAIIVAVCAGAKVAAAAGLLDGRRATTHWYYLRDLLDSHPRIDHVPDRRILVDRGVATTTGITASMPMMLTLIEAIAGRDKAEEVARNLGLSGWDARHRSDAFRFNRSFALTVMSNVASFWNRERLGIALKPGTDEVALALAADAWSRTYRSRAVTFAESDKPVSSRNGLVILPDEIADAWPADRLLTLATSRRPAEILDDNLAAIERRYGKRTGGIVAMQLEYPDRSEPAAENAGGMP